MAQPDRRAALSKQISSINDHSVLSSQTSYELSCASDQWNKMRLRRALSTESFSSNNSCSSCETDTSNISKQTTHRRVTFSLNPSMTIYEHSDNNNDDEDTFEKCNVITNKTAVNETETEAESSMNFHSDT